MQVIEGEIFHLSSLKLSIASIMGLWPLNDGSEEENGKAVSLLQAVCNCMFHKSRLTELTGQLPTWNENQSGWHMLQVGRNSEFFCIH